MRRERDHCAHRLLIERGKVLQDFGDAHAFGQAREDGAHRNASAFDYGLTATYGGVAYDVLSVVQGHVHPIFATPFKHQLSTAKF